MRHGEAGRQSTNGVLRVVTTKIFSWIKSWKPPSQEDSSVARIYAADGVGGRGGSVLEEKSRALIIGSTLTYASFVLRFEKT